MISFAKLGGVYIFCKIVKSKIKKQKKLFHGMRKEQRSFDGPPFWPKTDS
jgi:hypothetical protein